MRIKQQFQLIFLNIRFPVVYFFTDTVFYNISLRCAICCFSIPTMRIWTALTFFFVELICESYFKLYQSNFWTSYAYYLETFSCIIFCYCYQSHKNLIFFYSLEMIACSNKIFFIWFDFHFFRWQIHFKRKFLSVESSLVKLLTDLGQIHT